MKKIVARKLRGPNSLTIPGSIFCWLLSSIAIAQGEPATSDTNDGIPEIIVTAERRLERLQDVPVAVTALDGSTLIDRGFTDPQQIQYLAPSLQSSSIPTAPGVANYLIRGIGTGSFSNTIEYSVSTVLDNVVLGRPEMGVVQYFDVDRVEVLRGPQGTLFGKNASAGLVNIVSRRPVLNETSGAVRLESGVVNTIDHGLEGKAEGFFNLPLGSTTALRVSAFDIGQPALVKNLFPGNQSDFGFREGSVKAKLLVEPTGGVQILLAGDVARASGAGSSAGVYSTILPGSAIAGLVAAAGITASATNLQNAPQSPYDSHFTVGGVQAEVNYDLGAYSITNISASRFYELKGEADLDLLPVDFFDHSVTRLNDRQFTNEIRLVSVGNERFEHQLGLFYYSGSYTKYQEASARLGAPTLPPGIIGRRGGTTDATQNEESYAIYGQGTFRVTDALSVILGGRQTWDKIALDSMAIQGPNVQALYGVGSLTQSRKNHNFSYKGGLQYAFNPNVMTYFTFTRGYKGPAFNNTVSVASALPIDPEIPTAYEVGFKSSFLGNRVILNLAAFHETFRNYQAITFDAVSLSTVLRNAGAVTTKGVEAELTVRPTRSLTLSSSVTYDDAYYTSFPGVPCYLGQAGCVTVAGVATFNAAGQQLVTAPRWAGTVSAQYDQPISGDLRLLMGLSVYQRSSFNFTANQDPNTHSPGYTSIDANMGLASGPWRLGLFARNLFDKRIVTLAKSSPTGPTDYNGYYNISSFRTIGMTASLSF